MNVREALKIKRPKIRTGRRYEFYCTMQQEYEHPVNRMRNYTGQRVLVLRRTFHPGSADWVPGESERMYRVRAEEDGHEFEVFEGELNGWFKDTGQYFWPDGTFGPNHRRDYLPNERQPNN